MMIDTMKVCCFQTKDASDEDGCYGGVCCFQTKDAADDEDWCEDTSDAAVQARMEALSGAAKVMTISDDLEKSQQERIDMFYSFVKVCLSSSVCCITDRPRTTKLLQYTHTLGYFMATFPS